MVLATDMSNHFEQLKQMRLLLSEPDRYQNISTVLLLHIRESAGSLCRDGTYKITSIHTLKWLGKTSLSVQCCDSLLLLLLYGMKLERTTTHIVVMTFHFIVYHTIRNRPNTQLNCMYTCTLYVNICRFQYISVIRRASLQGPMPTTAHSGHLSSGQAVGDTHALDH